MPLEFILFDLDETLYPRESGLLKEVGRRIQVWVGDYLGLTWEEAYKVRRDYFQRYGTTLDGLIVEHAIDARSYLAFVHDVAVERYLKPNPALAAMLSALPLRRAIYTNATTEYTWRVLDALGVSDCFERVISIEDVDMRNKTYREAYERALALLGARGPACIMVEDSARNLRAAKALGMTTLLVGQDGSAGPDGPPDESVDFVVDNVLDVEKVVRHLFKRLPSELRNKPLNDEEQKQGAH
jgi:putative hydrolase of the HAD superfamily